MCKREPLFDPLVKNSIVALLYIYYLTNWCYYTERVVVILFFPLPRLFTFKQKVIRWKEKRET